MKSTQCPLASMLYTLRHGTKTLIDCQGPNLQARKRSTPQSDHRIRSSDYFVAPLQPTGSRAPAYTAALLATLRRSTPSTPTSTRQSGSAPGTYHWHQWPTWHLGLARYAYVMKVHTVNATAASRALPCGEPPQKGNFGEETACK